MFTIDEINLMDNLTKLMFAIGQLKTGGYEVDIDVKPIGRDDFLRININTNWPDFPSLNGQWWFDIDGIVVQVL